MSRPSMSGPPDTLFSVRNSFYLGAYQVVITDSELDGLTDAEVLERDTLILRSQLASRNFKAVLEGVTRNSPTAHQAVRLLALYQSGQKDDAKALLEEYLADTAIANNTNVLLAAGTLYTYEQDWNEALKHTHASTNLEVMALNVQIYLRMNRPDAAEKQLKAMQSADEDHTLTQLANAWINLALGGPKLQEAFYIFQEMGEKYMQTVPLMNGTAVCQMAMGQYDEAEGLLQEALAKEPEDADTLANLLVCQLQLGKSGSKLLSQLKEVAPNHVLVDRVVTHERAFDQALQVYG